jgi:UDP-N-acetylmuramoylalanine--D-glutamate ligase
MITSNIFRDKSYYVFGLSRTGLSVAKTLISSQANVTVWDDNQQNLGNLTEKCYKSSPKETDWSKIDYLVLSPGVPIIGENKNEVVTYAYENNVEIISDFDLLYQAFPNATYVGITGTNGKSTTTALIGHVLKNAGKNVQIGGNIGIPVLELEPAETNTIYVLEASSFQLDITKYLQFDIAAIINITPDHLDRHITFDNYLNAKKRIFTGNSHSIISSDYEALNHIIKDPITFSKKSENANFSLIKGTLKDGDLNFDFKNIKHLLGEHNYENILTAYVICKKLGIEPQEIVKHIHSFTGLPHRIELVLEKNGVIFINDSKATNADAAEKALNCFENIYWIVGGKAKTDGIDSLTPLFHKVKMAYLIGDSQERFEKVFQSTNCNYIKVGTIENALDQIKLENPKNGVVLLSPACASYDQFKDFEDRGNQYKTLVKTIF